VGALVKVLNVLLTEVREILAKLLELLRGQNLFFAEIGTPGHGEEGYQIRRSPMSRALW